MFIGLLLFSFSQLLTGPVPGLPNEVWLIFAGVILIGMSGALVNNNCMASLVKIYELEN